MKHILLPTDFSDNANNAMRYAIDLFKEDECTFYLVNTYTPMIYSHNYQLNSGGYLSDIVDTIRENSLEKLAELKSKFLNVKHTVQTISSFNTLGDELLMLTETKNIDLIIMGTKGASGVKELLFGSNTIHTIKKAKCPVLAIPDGYSFTAPKNILFPTDFMINYSLKHVSVLKGIAIFHKSKVHVVHVSTGVAMDQDKLTNKLKLESLLVNINDVYHTLTDQAIPAAINEYKSNNPVDLLMMINNKHSFFENLFFRPVINQIGFHLDVPFLVVPATM